MTDPALITFIQTALAQNIPVADIKTMLLAKGWQPAAIDQALQEAQGGSSGGALGTVHSPQTSGRRSFRVLLTGVLVFLFLAAAGGAGAFYYFQNTPEKKTERMWANLEKVKTVEYAGEISMELTLENGILSDTGVLPPNPDGEAVLAAQKGNFNFKFSGSSDSQDKGKPKSKFAFDLTAGGDSLPDILVGFEIITINQELYFQLKKLPNLGVLDLTTLKNQWIKLDLDDLAEQTGNREVSEAAKGPELTPETQAKITEAAKKYQILKNFKGLKGETIEGVDTEHYQFEVDKEELVKLVEEIIKIVDEKITSKELANLRESVTATEFTGGEFWLGKKDTLPYRLKMGVNVADPDNRDNVGKVTLDVNFKKYDLPVDIQEPEDFKTLEELMGDIQRQFAPDSSLFGDDLELNQLPTPSPRTSRVN